MYTKQQLREMGFAFDLNGNILSPRDLENSAANYVIEKSCKWLEKTLYIHTEVNEDKDWSETNPIDWVTSDHGSVEEFIKSYKEAMRS